jgi:hypothetical protein
MVGLLVKLELHSSLEIGDWRYGEQEEQENRKSQSRFIFLNYVYAAVFNRARLDSILDRGRECALDACSVLM